MSDSSYLPMLEVNLAAIARNYAVLRGKLANARCGAVVKANAYGLGAAEIAPVLFDAGCRDFFVATLEEGLKLREALSDAVIYIFHGLRKTEVKDFTHHRLIPVLNSPEQIEHWNDAGAYALHIDTGMCRLGLTLAEAEKTQPTANLHLVMSHLACANEPKNLKNSEQLSRFRTALTCFPGVSVSFSNSSGIFLGADYHFDLARPGCSLYGILPRSCAMRPTPVEHVATLSASVLQYRAIDRDQSVGYGEHGHIKAGAVLATVELGYADGLLRSLSNRGFAYAAGVRVPIIGRVSMDMVSVDVSAVPAHLRTGELKITFIGKEQLVDELADEAQTIGYEIFTRLGPRIRRVYSNNS